MVDVVVRNVGGGEARDIEFEFSSPMMSSAGFVLSALNYFRAGMNFLKAGRRSEASGTPLATLCLRSGRAGPKGGSR